MTERVPLQLVYSVNEGVIDLRTGDLGVAFAAPRAPFGTFGARHVQLYKGDIS